MNRLSFTFFRNMLWLWDLISLNLVIFLAGLAVGRANALSNHEYHILFLFMNQAWLVSVYLFALYLSKNWLDFKSFLKGTGKSYLSSVLIIFTFIFLYHYEYSRVYVITTLVSFGFMLVVNRMILDFLIFAMRDRSQLMKKVVVLGYNDQSKKLIKYFKDEAKLVKVSGCFDDDTREQQNGVPLIGTLKDCMPYVIENQVNEIYSTLTPEKYPYLYELAKVAEKHFVHFKFVPDYSIFVKRNVFVDFVDDIPVLSLRKEPLENTGNRILKRTVDLAISSFVILFILSWLIPLIAILIKLDSRGPVFFVQLRSGKNNKSFPCIKFRSLTINDEAHQKQVTRNDTRITRVGRIIRKTNIDELPQFFNVFLGQMSVVGPRPHMLKHTEDFSEIYKEYPIRHFVKPGLTGWAQVNHLRGEITNVELLRKRIEHDIWYMENWSYWLDLKIILLTIWVTLQGDKNAF